MRPPTPPLTWSLRLLLALILLASTAMGVRAVPPDSIDQALEKICQRGAAASAAEYCRAQLYLHIENPPLRSRWALRYLECLCQRALQDKSADPAVWEAIIQAEQEYRQQHADDPRLPWLAWQLARADLLRGQQALAKWLATPAAQDQREAAVLAVRRVQTKLDEVERDIKERLPLSQPRLANAASNQAPSRQLQELQIDCTALRCEALLVRARSYPVGTPDHLAALADVDRTATEVLNQTAADGPARQQLVVAQATAGLELGRRQESLETLTKIMTSGGQAKPALTPDAASLEQPSALARMRAGCALIEALCQAGQIAEAQRFQQALQREFDEPEVALSRLRINLAVMQTATAAQRPELLDAIVAEAAQLGQRYGHYWRNRGEALLVAAASSGQPASPAQPSPGQPSNSTTATNTTPNSGSNSHTGSSSTSMNSQLVTIEVRQLLAGGQTAAAIARLKKAVEDSTATQAWPEALAYALEAALLMQQEKQWLAAADLLEPLTTGQPDLPEAARGHVLAAWCVAQALHGPTPSAELKNRYVRLLQQQLRNWPAAQESIAAQDYLANWLTAEKRFSELAAMWSDRAAAVIGSERQQAAWGQWLDTLIARLPTTQLESELARVSQEISAGKFESCRRSATIATLAAAMLTLPLTEAEAETLTKLKLPGQNLEQPAGDQALLAALMTLAAARRHDLGDAQGSLGILDYPQLSHVVQLAWCRSMVEAFDELGVDQIAAWQAVAAGVRMPSGQDKLTPLLSMTQLRLEQLSARSEQARANALKSIEQLAGQHANDPALQLSLAAAWHQSARTGDSAVAGNTVAGNSAAAVRLLKRVAVGTKKESPTYLRARWLEAQWALASGDTAAAQQIAQLTLARGAIHPEWWANRFKKMAEGP